MSEGYLKKNFTETLRTLRADDLTAAVTITLNRVAAVAVALLDQPLQCVAPVSRAAGTCLLKPNASIGNARDTLSIHSRTMWCSFPGRGTRAEGGVLSANFTLTIKTRHCNHDDDFIPKAQKYFYTLLTSGSFAKTRRLL